MNKRVIRVSAIKMHDAMLKMVAKDNYEQLVTRCIKRYEMFIVEHTAKI